MTLLILVKSKFSNFIVLPRYATVTVNGTQTNVKDECETNRYGKAYVLLILASIKLLSFFFAYLTGGPLLQDGLSPTVLAYSRISTEARVILRSSSFLSTEYVLLKLSSNVLYLIMVLLPPNAKGGNDWARRHDDPLLPLPGISSSFMVRGADL